MRKYYLQGVLAWALAGVSMSLLWSSQVGASAWWLMFIVSPYIIAYTLGAILTKEELR